MLLVNRLKKRTIVAFFAKNAPHYGMQMLLVGDVRIVDKTPAATLRGDVNGDGEIDVRDITALIDIIMNA